MVPDDHDIGAALAVGQGGQAQAVGAAADVVHPIGNLVLFAEGGAAGGDVNAVGAFEDVQVLLDEGPEQAALKGVVNGLGRTGAGPIVVRGPPNFVGAGIGRGRC